MRSSCPRSDLAFSQVREDPRVEERALAWVLARRAAAPPPARPGGARPGLRLLLVGSGGCTALSLLALPHVAEVEVVDPNPAQLHLIELRRAALVHLPLDAQLRLVGAAGADEDERAELYDALRPALPEATRSFWDARPGEVAYGLHRVGRFEELFRGLARAFREAGLDPRAAAGTPAWEEVFERVFEREGLAATFGRAAVSYSMDRTFGAHFARAFAVALRRFAPGESYFVEQVWHDRYPDGVRPPYLLPGPQEAIRRLGAGPDRLRLHRGLLGDLLPRLAAEGGPFDLVHSSNVSDWMPVPEIHALLADVRAALAPHGALVARRLNGDHDLRALVSLHLQVEAAACTELLELEGSCFYSEVVAGFRPGASRP